MNRKSSLLEISKAYEQVLEEMNVGGEQMPQDVIIKNATSPDSNEIQFVATQQPNPEQSAEQMATIANSADMNKEKCPCETGECGQEEEEGCEECEGHSEHNENLKMAKSEAFKIKRYADEIFSLLHGAEDMEPWMLSKLVKAADYLCAVKGNLDYENYEKHVSKPCDDFSSDMALVSRITGMLNGENRSVNEEVLKRVIFNLEILKEIEK